MKFPRLAVAAVAVSISSMAIAGPDDTTKALMNESVSLLDWGNLRLQLILNRRPYKGNYSYVDYDFDANTIKIAHLVDYKGSEEDAENYYRSWFASVREWAGYDKDGTVQATGSNYGLFANLYAHNGYIQGSREDLDSLLADLEKKFRLEVRHPLASGLMSSRTMMKCTGKLQGTEISISVE
ncbi:hypothetical protein [Aliiroseovarius sediminis]|uniref:hypothetical protein n=1 Tax=Aliiroseovarius sediminis TaxID=2925839 RepID=UPI001F56AB54|nr:hypothetical protein [Aliiroseovarius sediminis]MCI2394079.1 hypothetical protein [Aliiroseovarius sediminis]